MAVEAEETVVVEEIGNDGVVHELVIHEEEEVVGVAHKGGGGYGGGEIGAARV